jgi:ubiquinone/menaquinone biosynthesis C-methylase UbiE
MADENINTEANSSRKLRFFNLDLHISVIADVKNIFESLGHEVVNWSISGHTWVFGKERDVVDVVNENTWGGLNQEMCDQFYERYKEFLNQFDGFIVTHNASFALLYEKFNKPIIIVNSTRYENPFTRSPDQWGKLNEFLKNGVESGKIFIVSNNKGDSYYLKYYTGINSDVIPSLCLYTNAKYRGYTNKFHCHALYGQEFDVLWNKANCSIFFQGLPWGYKWQDLYDLKGVVHFPYQISTMSLFEQYSANVPLFFPSKEFLFKLRLAYPNSILAHLSFLREADLPRFLSAYDDLNNAYNHDVIRLWIDLADYYDTENMPYIQYFNSFEELGYLLKTADCHSISENMKKHNVLRKQVVFEKWTSILRKIELSLTNTSPILSSSLYPQSYETWWETSLENAVPIDTFDNWLGDINASTRSSMRNYLKKMQYKSILDVPCGLCTDYFGLQQDNCIVDYLGVDITPKLVARAKHFSIPVVEGNIENLPFEDSRFEFAYARHILEHLPSYKRGLQELIRVASKEAYIVFFIKPDPELLEHKINLTVNNGCELYHNIYSKKQIEQFLLSQDKVSNFIWEEANINEVILHVLLNPQSN